VVFSEIERQAAASLPYRPNSINNKQSYQVNYRIWRFGPFRIAQRHQRLFVPSFDAGAFLIAHCREERWSFVRYSVPTPPFPATKANAAKGHRLWEIRLPGPTA
jgi:hypothetical protein